MGVITDAISDVADEVLDTVDPVKVHIVGTEVAETIAPQYASYRTIKMLGTEPMQQILPQNGQRHRAVLKVQTSAAVTSTPVSASGSAGNNTVSLNLGAVTGKTNYLSAVQVTGLGSTAGGTALLTLSGIVGGPFTYTIAIPADITEPIAPLYLTFDPPLPATGPNVAIHASLAAFGDGNTFEALSIQGLLEVTGGTIRIGRQGDVNNGLGAEYIPGDSLVLENSAALWVQAVGGPVNLSIVDELYLRQNQDDYV